VVDRTALEMRSTRKCTGGSNPSLSAKSVKQPIDKSTETLTAVRPALVSALIQHLCWPCALSVPDLISRLRPLMDQERYIS
jgi:hypothetical protein